MNFDVLLPLALFLISLAGLTFFSKFAGKLEPLFQGQRIRVRDALLIVLFLGAMVTAVVFIPGNILQILFLFSCSSLLFLLVYIIFPAKWPVAFILPGVFLLLYFFYWNIWLMDVFAVLLILSVIMYTSAVFTWKATLAFAGFLTVMDVVQVFGTKYMAIVAEKATSMLLPLLIVVPTFPLQGYVSLGLGDLMLTGLFVNQTAQKWGKRYGYICCGSIALVLLLGELILFNTPFHFLPATIFVSVGWLVTLGLIRLTPIMKTDQTTQDSSKEKDQ